MKNLNDELQKLGEYQYKVSDNFSQRVMKEIHKNHFFTSVKYVISFASIAAVACFAFVLSSHSGLKDQFLNRENDSQKITAESSYDLAKAPEDFSTAKKEQSLNNTLAYNAMESVQEEEERLLDADDTLDKKAGTSLSLKENIIAILQKAGYKVEELEDGLRVKGSKEEISNLLKDFNDLKIEEENDFVKITL